VYLEGRLDLGSGTLTIYDGGRPIFVGRQTVTAEKVEFRKGETSTSGDSDMPTLYLADGSSLDEGDDLLDIPGNASAGDDATEIVLKRENGATLGTVSLAGVVNQDVSAPTGGSGSGSNDTRTALAIGGETVRIAGRATGLDRDLGNGFGVGLGILPQVSVADTDGRSEVGGSLLTLRGRRREGSLFAGLHLAHGRFGARTVLDDPAGGDSLAGSHGLTMNRLQLQGGIRTEIRGLEAAAFTGRLDHDAHVARGSVLQAEIPAYGQAYDGWKIGLRLAPSSWLKGQDGLRWRPVVNVSTQRLHGGSGTVPDVYREVRSGAGASVWV